MLLIETPIGIIEAPKWKEKELKDLTDDELLSKALKENKDFVISPATFAMIERRFLVRKLQQLINPHVGFRHDTTYCMPLPAPPSPINEEEK